MEQSEYEAHAADPSDAALMRVKVAQATGVLGQFGIDPEAAFDKLAAVARENQRPIVEVAREIVEKRRAVMQRR